MPQEACELNWLEATREAAGGLGELGHAVAWDENGLDFHVLDMDRRDFSPEAMQKHLETRPT